MNKRQNQKLTVQEITQVGLAAALISIMAQISIPMPAGVPMTLQTFAVPLVGIILGSRKGTIAALVYVLLGAVGLPVFSGFTGGIGIVLGVTGGFIVTFPIMAWMAGIGQEKGGYVRLYAGLILGAVVNYLIGMAWFVAAAKSTWTTAFTACVLPFIPTTIIKIVLAGILGKKIREVMIRAGALAA